MIGPRPIRCSDRSTAGRREHRNPRGIRSVDLGGLRNFDALMRDQSVSRAGLRLFLGQPDVSASRNRRRDLFDDPLFTRTSHGVVPTARVQVLTPQREQVLTDVAALLEGGQEFDPARSHRIFRIAGSDHASRLVLPALARDLADMSSPIRIGWASVGVSPLAERLKKREFDLALVVHTHCDQLLAHELPFALPGYRMLLCWSAKAGADRGLQWPKDRRVAIAAGSR
jgi:DNA-binding transcriptional LysR family regulator